MIDPGAIGRGYWLQSSGDDLTPRKSLTGDLKVDVAIVGGGFSGLWTAYYLLKQCPGIEVAVIEQETCGYGASGRNGGWVSPRYPSPVGGLIRQVGMEIARRIHLELYQTADEIERICKLEGIEADYKPSGILSIARGEAQRANVHKSYETYAALGLSQYNHLLDQAALAELVAVSGSVCALQTTAGGTLNPGKLVRGLARAVERLGGIIYEGTAVASIMPESRLHTQSGIVIARRAIVVATEAYISKLPDYKRKLLPISSTIILTEPLSPEQWREIGWAGYQGLSSQALMSNYLSRTVDGRIIYGSRGAPYLFNSRIDEQALNETSTYVQMRAALTDWFPNLAAVKVSHAWGGYLGVTRDWGPSVNFDRQTRLAHLMGFAGRGVATTNLAARLLVGQLLDRETGLEYLPMLRPKPPAWEPEPFRWLGVRYVQGAFQRIDDAESHNRHPPLDTALAKALSQI